MSQKLNISEFMQSSAGRALKALCGILIVFWGFSLISVPLAIIVMLLGGTIFLAGVLNFSIVERVIELPLLKRFFR